MSLKYTVLPHSIIITALLVISALFFCSTVTCYDDSIYESMQQEKNSDTLYAHRTYFDLPDTGQTQDFTAIHGEDSDDTSLSSPSYTDNTNGTVTDNITGLMWTRCSMKENSAIDDTADCSSVHGTYNNSAAATSCSGLTYAGHSDWRLPTVPELISIVNYGKPAGTDNNPAIDESFFPGTEYADGRDSGVQSILKSMFSAKQYWTRTSHYYSFYGVPFYSAINFDDGLLKIAEGTNSFYVRCVRGPGTK